MHAVPARLVRKNKNSEGIMLILSNGLTEVVDEGFLKVANSLVKRIKKSRPDVEIVSYERQSSLSDHYIELNKLLINKKLISLVRKHRDNLLYVPFPAKSFATALRIFILSLYKRSKMSVILVMQDEMNFIAKLLMKFSNAEIYVLSRDSENYYKSFICENRVKLLKAGIDTKKFIPVDIAKQKSLKEKYGFDKDKSVVLHVGHLKNGRNVGELAKVSKEHQVLLVTSTLTASEQDAELREKLLSQSNVKIISEYLPAIEEIYQLSDIYFFPTVARGNCIDIPLSCMEAASCGKPILTTDYGAMKDFKGKDGFFFIDKLDTDSINSMINEILARKDYNSRDSVIEYDWDSAVSNFC